MGVTKHFESESPTLNSAQVFKMSLDFDTTSSSPSGAVTINPLSSYTYSNINSSITNTAFADMASLRSNAYHSVQNGLTSLSESNAVKTDELRLSEDGFQTIQPPTFDLSSSLSFGASDASRTEYFSDRIEQCQGVSWKLAEAKVGGVDVPWVLTQTQDKFMIEPSLATGAGVCWGIAHTLDLKFELDTPGKIYKLRI